MILRGILATSLGGFVCVRGFARLGDLARFSYSDTEFQRTLINRHRDDIADFLRERDSVFFPEVILSCQLERMCQSGETPPTDLLRQLVNVPKAFSKTVGGLTIKKQAGIKFQSENDMRVTQQIPFVTLAFSDEYWSEVPERPLFRIDGNHRLSASVNTTDFDDYLTPFCVILFDAHNNRRSYERTIFHTINSKVVPLTSEQNLRVILGDDANDESGFLFSDDDLKNAPYFGWSYYFTRRLLRRLNLHAGRFGHLAHLAALRDAPRSTLLALINFLGQRELIKEVEAEEERLFDALRHVDRIYENESRLHDNRCKGLLVAFVYYQLEPSTKLAEVFRNWVLSGHLYDIEEIEAKGLIGIFDKIMRSRSRTIFVSMQFSNDTDRHYDMIKEAVDEINKDYQPDIKLEQIRVDKFSEGHSYQIPDQILDLIKNSGLLIADLTKSNINVYHEIGYLMGVNEGRGLPQDNFILILRKERDGSTDKVGFNLQPWQQIRFNDTAELKNEIKNSIRKYYRLQ